MRKSTAVLLCVWLACCLFVIVRLYPRDLPIYRGHPPIANELTISISSARGTIQGEGALFVEPSDELSANLTTAPGLELTPVNVRVTVMMLTSDGFLEAVSWNAEEYSQTSSEWMITNNGWLLAMTVVPTTENLPQGSIYVNLFLKKNVLLASSPTGSFYPVGFGFESTK